jgi:hypothetical protein
MADKLEALRKRKPWDEIDPETGAPVEDIPGLENPPELQFAEDLGIAAATGGAGFGPKAILRAAGKTAAGKAKGAAISGAEGRAREMANMELTKMPAQEAAAIRKDPAKMQELAKKYMAPEASPRTEYKPNISEGKALDYGVKDVPAADRTAPRRIQELQKMAKIPEDQIVGKTPSGTPIVKEPPKPVKFREHQGDTHQQKMAQQRKESGSAVMNWLKGQAGEE